MLPFIIGGVALAATGYGIKKYLEEEVIIKSKIPRVDLSEFLAKMDEANSPDSVLEEYRNIKLSLEKTTLNEMQNAFKEIKNLNFSTFKTLELNENNDKELLLDKSDTPLLEEFINILSNARTMQEILLDELDKIIANSDDYHKYSEEQKMKVQEVIVLYEAAKNAINLPLTYDGVSINRTIKRAFAKLKKLVEVEIR